MSLGKLGLFLLPVLMLVLIVGSIFSFLSSLEPPQWTLAEINRTFDGALPLDGSNIVYNGRLGRGGFLQLSFEAPASTAQRFLSHICSGQLHKGYDPFSAIDIAEPIPAAYLIHLDIYTYFSYSPNTPSSVLGNRCLSDSYSQIQVRVDTSATKIYKINLDLRFSCTVCITPATSTIQSSYPLKFPIKRD